MPTNLYGPNDNFDPGRSHVLAALLLKAHEAKQAKKKALEVWGSGRPRREFLHVDDMAAACVHLMDLPEKKYWAAVSPHCSHINAGTGQDLSIAELAELALRVVGHEAKLKFDTSRPDGVPQKLLDISRIKSLGWEPNIRLAEGMRSTYEWMLANWDEVRGQA
jgi:GDP-L-fucose synthase